MNRIKALIKKEFFQIIKDPSSILVSFVLPLILLFLYAYGVSLDMNHLRIGLVLEDTTEEALSFADSLKNSTYFEVTEAKDRREIEEKIVAGTIRGLVIVPPYFTTFLKGSHEMAPIQVISDGSEPNTATFIQNYVQGAYSKWLLQESIQKRQQLPSSITIQPRFWYNEQLESRNFLIPGSLAIIMTLIGTLLTALVVAREWERGTMEALMATPVTIFELVISKLIPYFLLGLSSMTLLTLIATLFLKVPLRGSLLVLELISAVFLFTACLLGLLISTLSKNQMIASQASIVSAFLPAFILSGFLFEIASMPYPVQLITHLIPARYFVTCLQTVFLTGNIWAVLIPNTLIMLVIGLFFLTGVIHLTKKRL
jgi:ABC-2 type transport system permease protein